MSKSKWSNKLSFIITTSAFAVGLGNIWRFPYITGESGGGAFLLVYIILVLLVGIPLLIIEIGLGRKSETTALLGYGKLGKHKLWNIVGWVEFLTVFLIMSFYVMILAWVVIYTGEFLWGNTSLSNAEQYSRQFSEVSSNINSVLIGIIGILVLAALIVGQGLQKGIEKYSKGMMIALLLMLVALAIWAATLEGAMEGYKWYLKPDFSKINLDVILSAIGQLFFSLGVGMTAAFVFGSYTSKKDNLITSTAWIVFADTFVAILAGFVIFPALFSFNLEPDSGPNLIFITMASVFGSINYGNWIGAFFFILLFLAGFTSLIACIQGMKDSIKDKFKLNDNVALTVIMILVFFVSIPVVLSYTNDPWMIFQRNFYNTLDYITGNVLLPLSGLLIVVFGVHIVGYKALKEELNQGAENIKIAFYWKPILKWLIPIVVLVIMINGLI